MNQNKIATTGPHSFTDNREFHCRCGGGPFWEEENKGAR